MATYYVRPDGNDSNTGLGSTAFTAWRTVQKAINTGGVTSGDTVYIAPGTYRETAWSGQTFTSTTTFIGDALAVQFSGVTPGPVIISTRPSDGAASTVTYLGYVRSFTTIQNLYFDSSQGVLRPYGENIVISDCVFQAQNSVPSSSQLLEMQLTGTGNITIRRCIGSGFSEINCGGAVGNTGTGAFRIESCIFYSSRFFAGGSACAFVIANSIFINSLSFVAQHPSGTYVVFNCILGQLSFVNTSGTRIENYNYYTGSIGSSRNNVGQGASSIVNYGRVTNWGYFAQNNMILTGEQAPIQDGPLKGTGTVSLAGYSAPTNDLYNKPFSSPPDIGAVSSAALSGSSYYVPTERNASVITTAPGSTSQTVELYLGATGLTATTTGLRATYARTRSATVSVPLVSQTTTGAWISGGFCEISASTMPGMYRLDVPNAAFADGADNVTIFVGGASGTNGAVQTVNLEYPNASVLRMGPYKLISNHMGADNPLEVLKGVQAPVDLQLVDNSGGGVDITGATVTAKIYNASSQLIDTYTCTPTYALDGRCSFNLDTTVTDNSGHYTVTVTRQVGGNIVVFGPLRCLVRAN